MKENAKIFFERYLPVLIAFLLAGFYWFCGRHHAPAVGYKDLLQVSLNVGAIAVGFLISAKAILLTIANSRVVRPLKDSGHFAQIVSFFICAISWCLASTILSAALLWLDYQQMDDVKIAVLLVWFFVVGGALGATARAVRTFGKLVAGVAKER